MFLSTCRHIILYCFGNTWSFPSQPSKMALRTSLMSEKYVFTWRNICIWKFDGTLARRWSPRTCTVFEKKLSQMFDVGDRNRAWITTFQLPAEHNRRFLNIRSARDKCWGSETSLPGSSDSTFIIEIVVRSSSEMSPIRPSCSFEAADSKCGWWPTWSSYPKRRSCYRYESSTVTLSARFRKRKQRDLQYFYNGIISR